MLNVKVVYNNKCAKDVSSLLEAAANPMFEYFNEDEPKDLKKAWKFKGEAGARQVPFIGVYEDKKLIKAFYAEDKSYKGVFDWLEDYIETHSKKGWMEISKVEGVNNKNIKVGDTHSGYTRNFCEGCALYLISPSHWFHTSIITSIDWENKTFKTLNSTYSFTLHEETEEKHQETSKEDNQSDVPS